MGADRNNSNSDGRHGQSAALSLEAAYRLGVTPLSELHNSILNEVFNALTPQLSPAQIFDAVSKEFSAETLLEITRAIVHLEREGFLLGEDVFIEPSCGVARRKEIIYSITKKGRMHLLGLILLSGILPEADRPAPEDLADMISKGLRGDGSPSPQGASSIAASGGEALFPSSLPGLASPPSTIPDQEIARVNRVMDALPELCSTCGRVAKHEHECRCGMLCCEVHWYDADGNHTLNAADGFCGGCVDAIREQAFGEERCGRVQ